jgi:hypothetical protein
MITKVKINTIFNCSLERAFKTPILCDVSKIHNGYGVMPKVTHCTEDENWGKPGFTKRVYAEKSWTQKGGFVSLDKVLDRKENQYWKIQVSKFQSWMLGFYKFEGEWQTTQIDENKILIEYTYTMYSNIALLYPLCFLFTNLFWKAYMKRVIENVRQLAYNNEPYIYQ